MGLIEDMRSLYALIIIIIFISLVSCITDIDKDSEVSLETNNRLTYYKPVPERPKLISIENLDYHREEENNIKKKYIIQSNKHIFPVNYGISADEISLMKVLFENEGMILDYTPAFDEILLVLEGELKLVIDNHFEYILSPNNAVFISSKVRRRIINNYSGDSECFIISSPPYDPDSLNEEPVTIDNENIENYLSSIISIEETSFLDSRKVHHQKLFHPDIEPTSIALGIITIPSNFSLRDIHNHSESIYYRLDEELIIRDNKLRNNYLISEDSFLYIPNDKTISIYNNSTEVSNILYFYPIL